MLAVNGLGFRHRCREILKDISFTVSQGEMVSLIGPNGAGKSTLLKCIFRIFIATEGSVIIDGEDAFLMGPARRLQRIAYMPQEVHFSMPLMTVFDVVVMGRSPYSAAWQPTEKDIDMTIAVLDAFRLDPAMDFNELSGCERQMALFARALVQGADYMLIDEPLSNLDLRRRLEVLEYLKAVASERHTGVLIVLHDLNLAYRFSDQVVMLNEGRLVSKGAACSVMNERNINTVYGIRMEEIGLGGFRHLAAIGPATKGNGLH